MARPPVITLICSDQHRTGKTLLARVIIDFLLLLERDPFVIDANPPQGVLRAVFPGRTVLVDFTQVQGQMKLFDTILNSPGRDYVIDLAADNLELFFTTCAALGFFNEASKTGYQIRVFFIPDKQKSSQLILEKLRRAWPKLSFITVYNEYVISVVPPDEQLLRMDIPVLDHDSIGLIENKRFSIRNFMLGDMLDIPRKHHERLRRFFEHLLDQLGDIESAIAMLNLRQQL